MKNLILDEVAAGRVVPPVDVLSAGTHAADGQSPSRFAVETAAGHGISIRFHRARLLTAGLVRFADLILVMEREHADFIRRVWPETRNVEEVTRYLRDGSLPAPDRGIADPVGRDIGAYRAAFGELQTEITRISKILFPRVLNMNHLT